MDACLTPGCKGNDMHHGPCTNHGAPAKDPIEAIANTHKALSSWVEQNRDHPSYEQVVAARNSLGTALAFDAIEKAR
jgi:hypothetical protein